MEAKDILTMPVSALGLSEAFNQASIRMGICTLEDVIFILPDQLLNKDGFSYGWLGELSAYLDEKGLLYLLQPLPGKSYG